MKQSDLEKCKLTNENLHLFNDEQLHLIFKLIYSAAPDFYQIFLSDQDDKNAFVALFKGQLTSGSELEEITVYSWKKEVVGVTVCYETSLSAAKRQFSTLLLLRGSKRPDSFTKLREFDLNFPSNNIPNGAKYLSRIAIRDKYKGSGLSKKIFADVCLDAPQFTYKNLYLHVHKQNERAIKFYNKMKMIDFNSSQNTSIYTVMEGKLT